MQPRTRAILRWLPLLGVLLLLGALLLELDPVESWRRFHDAWLNGDGLVLALALFVVLSPLTLSLFRGQRHFVFLAVVIAYAAYEALMPPYQIRGDLLFLWPAMLISFLRWYRYSREPHGSGEPPNNSLQRTRAFGPRR